MKSADARHDEAAAVAALERLDVLDSAPEAEFDALVRAASAVCGTPISLISLIDANRQWFKANIGLTGVTETPRDLAFCAHAVLHDDLFEVADAAHDPRFFDNPLVADDPRIRFYAGAPLRLSSGELVGTLCVIDRQPRVLDATQREVLRCLGLAATRALEGRRAQRDLARVSALNEDRLRRMYESTPAMMHSVDRQGRLLAVSELWLSKLGYTRDEVIGRSAPDFLSPASRERAFATVLPTLFDVGRVDAVEYQVITRDGRMLDVLLSAVVQHDGDGAAASSLSVMEDITERKHAEAELLRINQRFLLAAGSVGLGVWEYDVVAGTLAWDDRMYELYGSIRSDSPETYELWSSRLHPGDRDRAERELNLALAGKGRFDSEFRIVHADGNVRHIKAAANIVRDAAGAALRMTGVNFDVTERVHADVALRETMTLLNAVLDSATQSSIIAVKPDGLVNIFNTGAQALLGYSSAEVTHRVSSLLFHDRDELHERAQALSERLGRRVSPGAVLIDPATRGKPHEWTYRRKDGSGVPVALSVTAMHDDQGELFGYLGIAHDITLQKQQEQTLREAVRKANQASLAKSQFLANMSHEIRTPMNAVIGLSYLLERTPLDAEQAAFLAKIKLASKSLLAIINDVLDLSKIEASEMKMERAPFSVTNLLSELATLMAIHAESKGITFAIDAPADLPVAVQGDATRVQQVLTNLLSNAIKFTQRGGVRMTVRRVSESATATRLRFVTRDSGIGIAPDALGQLFTPFVQADTSTTRRFGGTGLGLSIVKQMVNLMGGEVGVASTPGVGSEFWAELEFPICDAATVLEDVAPAAAGQGLRGVRILVADDSAINLEVARRILELEGATVWLACDGQEAVDRLLAMPQGIDVVLMDVQMPVLDGHDATRRIRADLGLTDLPIIALTAGISTDEREGAQAAGMNDVVGKPFDPQKLVRCIRRHVRVVDAGTAEPAALGAPAVRGDWPDIEGIDARDVSVRLGGDVKLFRSMLKRLLSEFSGIECGPAPDAAELGRLAARMHNLKGGAGTLGATAIAGLAARAEQACRQGESTIVVQLVDRLMDDLRGLGRIAAPVLDDTDAPSIEAHSVWTDEPDAQSLDKLRTLLKQSDLGAMACFATLSAPLRRLLGTDAHAALREQVENLQFTEALESLQAVRLDTRSVGK